METAKRKLARRLLAALTVMLAAFLSMSCDGTPPVIRLKSDAQVRREIAKVWAGPGNVSPLPLLGDGDWHDLAAGGLVNTDASGEGWINVGDCMTIYVFQDSGLIKAACPKSSYSGGNVTCSIAGTSVYNNSCASEVIIETPSAEIQLEGTWLSVTYHPALQVSTIIVFSGAAKVRPVRDLDKRELGSAVTIGKGSFWFSAPDNRLPALQGLPVRQALPVSELPPLSDRLNLTPWLDAIGRRSELDKVVLRGFQTAPLDTTISLQLTGGAFDNSLAQEAVLQAVPWAEMSKSYFPNQDASFDVELRGKKQDARSLSYNLDTAQQFLTRAGFSRGFSLLLLYPQGDEQLGGVAREMADRLPKLGIKVEVTQVSSREAFSTIRAATSAGQAVIWLSR